MVKALISRTIALGALLLPVAPALAQETGGLRLTLGVEQRFEVSDNLALATPSKGTTTSAATRLSFGLLSDTAIQHLALDISATFRLADEAGGKSTAAFDSPRADFSYSRDGANAALSFSAAYSRDRIEFLRPLSDFTNGDGVVELPPDLADLSGTGERAVTSSDFKLDLGTASPLGVSFSAGLNKVEYLKTSDPALVSSQTITVGSTARLNFSDITVGRVFVGASQYDAEDTENTRIDTSSVEIGVTRQISPIAELDAALGYGVTKTRELGVTTRDQGPTGTLGLTYQLANGTADAVLVSATDQNGNRLSLEFGRALNLATGTFSARLGLTRTGSDDPLLIGALVWQNIGPAGTINARLSREVATTDIDVETATTLASLAVTHEVNAVSSLGLDLTFAVIDETGVDQVERSDLSARYTRAITDDWNMNFGVILTRRNQASSGNAKSESVFLTLSRDFDLRP